MMSKIVIKYSKEYPYLPEMIAKNKAEMARMLGVHKSVITMAFQRASEQFAEVEVGDE